MAMPMTGMPASGWKAEGLLGGLYGGMQAQYQSDAMRDATRAAELDHAIKQYELRQKIADEPAVEAERAARITRANEFNTLSPTRIEDAQTSLEDKKYSSEQRKKVDKLADAAEFFASTSEAMKQAATDPEGGGRLSPGYRALWKQYQDEAKARGLDIGDEWSLENEQKLHNRGLKAQNSLKHIQKLQTIIAQGNQQERVASGNRASAEKMADEKRVSNELIQAQHEENANYRADLTVNAANARASAAANKPMNMGQLRAYYTQLAAAGTIEPGQAVELAHMKGLDLMKFLGADPATKLAALQTENPALYQEHVRRIAEAVSSSGAALSQGAPTPTQPNAPATTSGWSARIKQ